MRELYTQNALLQNERERERAGLRAFPRLPSILVREEAGEKKVGFACLWRHAAIPRRGPSSFVEEEGEKSEIGVEMGWPATTDNCR